MKNILIFLLGLLINALYLYVIGPIFITGIMAWIWLPIVFDINNYFGGVGLGLVLGIIISVGTEIIKQKVSEKLSY